MARNNPDTPQVGEEHYMNVGSAKGPRGLKVGDFATVSCTGVSSSKKDNPVYRIRSAKITDNEPLAADSVETLAIMCGDHHIPQQVNIKKGNRGKNDKRNDNWRNGLYE